jgi:hypothetical protein
MLTSDVVSGHLLGAKLTTHISSATSNRHFNKILYVDVVSRDTWTRAAYRVFFCPHS